MTRAMKDSGIEWIGEIPEGWHLSRLGWCLDEIKEKNDPIKTTNVLSLTNKLGVIPYEEKGNQGNKAKEDYSQYGLAFENTLVINSMNVLIGSVGISKYYGCVSPVYYVFKNTDKADLRFINYLFQNVGFQKELRKYANGILEIRLRISSHDMLRRIIPLPDIREQKSVCDYLDVECARIDAVIEQTRASIEEYKKLKQSVITQAVTKGIRPGRKMKDSGVEWIGVVPEEWVVTKLKYFSSIRPGITLGKTYPRDTKLVEYPYLRVANVQGSYTDLTDVATIFVTEEEAEKYQLHDGELLMTEGGDRDKLGRGTVWHAEIDPCLHQNHVFALTTNDDLSAEYVSFLSASLVGRDYFEVTANQSVHLASTNSTTIMNFTIPVPSIEEQNEIVSYLTEKIEELEKLIAKKQALISDLEYYKKSLIFEYVTGKKEVVKGDTECQI